nr:hypothetical protein [Streptomyces viridochromogenes]
MRTTTPHPSPRTMPSAEASNGRHTPDGDNAPTLLRNTLRSGVMSRLTPPARAVSQSPVRRLCTAWCTASRDEEQAELTVDTGPWRSKV